MTRKTLARLGDRDTGRVVRVDDITGRLVGVRPVGRRVALDLDHRVGRVILGPLPEDTEVIVYPTQVEEPEGS